MIAINRLTLQTGRLPYHGVARRFITDLNGLQQIYWGALLHDIGKIGVPDVLLLKPDPLTESE